MFYVCAGHLQQAKDNKFFYALNCMEGLDWWLQISWSYGDKESVMQK
jgi:hypothetical protein